MNKTMRSILAASLAVCVAAGTGRADNERQPAKPGPAKWQLSLKQRLAKVLGEEGLSGSLDHARLEWSRLTADQKDQMRAQALAFLKKGPQEQERLLAHYDQLVRMTAERREAYRQRAEWLKAAIDWLQANDPGRIEQMKAMNTEQRAEAMVELRERLLREGKIVLPGPEAPATREAPGD